MTSIKKILVLPPVRLNVKTGGPEAVVKLMYQADPKNFEYILDSGAKNKENPLLNKVKKLIKSTLLKNIWIRIIYLYLRNLYLIRKRISTIKSADIIISHQIFLTHLLLKIFPNKKIITITHSQGSSYSELTDLNQCSKSKLAKKYLDKMETIIYKRVYKFGFPSRGAEECLIKTNPSLKFIKKLNNKHILYNGINTKIINQESKTSELTDIITPDKIIFCTVCDLSYAKGVERVPAFLKKLKDKRIEFQWILIGNGKTEELIEKEIRRHNIKENTHWFKKRFLHEEIITLFRNSDFYILFHRHSIFDLAILEAMYCETIPVLSNIGGNKEMNLKNNAILLNQLDNIQPILDLINNRERMEMLKKLNKKLVEREFNLNKFINRYQRLISE